MKTCQAFIRDHLKLLQSAEQWAIASRNQQTIVINTYSFDEFIPYKLVTHQFRKQCRAFQMRKQYALPNTPKIILVEEDQKKDQQLLMLAQRGQFPFQKLVAHYQDTQKGELQLALQIVIVAEMLQKKYGNFKFTQAMIRASKLPTLLVWINQNQASNQPQFPIQPIYPLNLESNKKDFEDAKAPMSIMIISLLEIFYKRMRHNLFSHILSQKKSNLTFQDVKKELAWTIKEQISSQCTIATPECDKYRRYTQQKRRKIPQFLVNKTTANKEQKKNKSQHNQVGNKKSALTFLQNTKKIQQFRENGIRKICVNKIIRPTEPKPERDHHLLFSLHFNSQGSVKNKGQIPYLIQKEENKNTQSQNIRSTQPIKSIGIIQHQIYKKEENIIVRDSGKSVSTSSANYFSSSGSGKRFNSTFTQGDEDNKVVKLQKNKYMNSESMHHYQYPNKEEHVQLFKYINKKEVKVSRIIEQNMEDPQTHSYLKLGHSPRAPSIVKGFNSPTGIQINLNSPGSQFYNDVDNLLHSGALSPKRSAQIDNTIEVELNKILFD